MKPFDWWKECVKIFLILVYKFSFLHISNTYRIFNRTEYILYVLIFHRVKRCCIFIFTYAERWVLIYSIIVWRINKIHNYVFVGKLSHSLVLFVLFTWVVDQGPSRTVAFFRITNKILKVGTCHFTIIERKITVIFREHFSSLRFDSGNIFKIIISCCTPRTTYTIFNFELRMYYACTICMN